MGKRPSDLDTFLERVGIIQAIADPALTAKAGHLLLRLLEEYAEVQVRRDTVIEDAFRGSVGS